MPNSRLFLSLNTTHYTHIPTYTYTYTPTTTTTTIMQASSYINRTKLIILYRALIIYNATTTSAATTATAIRNPNPILYMRGQQLALYIYSPQGRTVLALLGQDVEIVRGNVRPY